MLFEVYSAIGVFLLAAGIDLNAVWSGWGGMTQYLNQTMIKKQQDYSTPPSNVIENIPTSPW
jgi:hypothetical protein